MQIIRETSNQNSACLSNVGIFIGHGNCTQTVRFACTEITTSFSDKPAIIFLIAGLVVSHVGTNVLAFTFQ